MQTVEHSDQSEVHVKSRAHLSNATDYNESHYSSFQNIRRGEESKTFER